MNEQNAKARSGTRGKRGNFDGKVLSRIANGISFTRFVLLLSWLPMFENVKVITERGKLHFGPSKQANINFTEPSIKLWKLVGFL